MNCPKCKSGVMESLWFIPLKEKLEFEISLIPTEERFNPFGIYLSICSVDHCGFTELKAAPGTLSEAKRIVRDRLYKNNLQPDAVTSLSYEK